MERRQQNTQAGSSTSTAASNANAGTTVTGTITSAATGTGTPAGTGSTSQQIGITGGPGYNASASHASTVAANGAPGEIVFTQPPLQSTSYYKIAPSNFVTFGWNFSYVAVTPTSLTVSAACENGNTYPVGPSNGVIAGNAQSVVWDLWAYQTANPNLPLAQATYTLLIFGSGGPSAIPTPGYLAPNSELQFALYTPQGYTPLASGWQCAGCGGALSQFTAYPASIALLTTLLVVFLSGFTTLRRVWD